jgi:hypothetical protein
MQFPRPQTLRYYGVHTGQISILESVQDFQSPFLQECYGLMWIIIRLLKVFTRKIELMVGLRHSCEIGDHMASYGWTEYDGRHGRKQLLSDRGMKVDIETEFIKVPGQNGI